VLATLPAVVTGLACVEADSEPPTLEAARFVDVWTLELEFSEAIAAPSDVDPASHFRLGSGMVLDDGSGGELTVYYDLAHHFPAGIPGTAGDAAGPWVRHGFTEIVSVSAGDAPNRLRLRLSYPLEHYVCDAIVEATSLGIPAAIHLHYAEGSSPRITDLAGNPLADIGAWWVHAAFATTIPGAYPELDPRLPIPCP
jgi:hypothetical protein